MNVDGLTLAALLGALLKPTDAFGAVMLEAQLLTGSARPFVETALRAAWEWREVEIEWKLEYRFREGQAPKTVTACVYEVDGEYSSCVGMVTFSDRKLQNVRVRTFLDEIKLNVRRHIVRAVLE